MAHTNIAREARFRAATQSVAKYDPASVEANWQVAWRDAEAFATPPPVTGRRDVYIFPPPPFTSGNAHIGHVRNYTLADIYARFRRVRGDAVLFALGFDGFGLPSELRAIEHGVAPSAWVDACRESMTALFERLGYSFDWSRTFVTCDEDCYRWTQWLFLKLLEQDMVYRAPAQVDWCDGCRTVLAGLQVQDGCCWRCHAPVRLVKLPQWYLRVTAYAEETERCLECLTEWNAMAMGAQRAVIGATVGVELEAVDVAGDASLTVFCASPHALSSVAFVALSPRHPDVGAWAGEPTIEEALAELSVAPRRRADRKADKIPVVDTGRRVRIPGLSRDLPVLVTPAVDARFGSTAVAGVPTADRTDAAIAERLGCPTYAPTSGSEPEALPARRRRVRDVPLSRQRSWGTPIPLVNCPSCGMVPVPFSELPVQLPDDLVVTGEGQPLAEHPTFASCACARCGEPARRETDTLDCHADALWAVFGACAPAADRSAALFEHPEVRRWLPMALFVGGADQGPVMHDIRVVAKALRDAGVLEWLEDGEPMGGVLMHEMIRMDGRKMSKHLGNVVDPAELVERYGADAVRLSIVYAAAPSRAFDWTDEPIQHCRQFLDRLWEYCAARRDFLANASEATGIDTSEPLRRRLELWTRTAAAKVTDDLETKQMHKAARNVMRLLDGLEDFEQRVRAGRNELDEHDREAVAYSVSVLLRLLAPFAPHLAEELWAQTGGQPMLATGTWPWAS